MSRTLHARKKEQSTFERQAHTVVSHQYQERFQKQ